MLLFTSVGLGGCGPISTSNISPATQSLSTLDTTFFAIVTERTALGPRLVAVQDNGDRKFEMIERWTSLARDSNAAISPDGTQLVFASSRGRMLDVTSLWLAPVGFEQPARRLTTGQWIDTHPIFSPDGRSVVFASTRSGSFDLWRLQLASGELSQLTTEATHEVMPAIDRTGRIVFAVVAPEGQTPSSHLAVIEQDQIRRITDGPADTAPTFRGDGATIVFSAPHVRAAVDGQPASVDGDLWQVTRDGHHRQLLLDVADTDEGGAVFSSDGRTMLSTSLFRANDGTVLFSSVIAADNLAIGPVALLKNANNALITGDIYMLKDRAGGIERLNVVLPPSTIVNHKILASAPLYLPALRKIVLDAMRQRKKSTPQ